MPPSLPPHSLPPFLSESACSLTCTQHQEVMGSPWKCYLVTGCFAFSNTRVWVWPGHAAICSLTMTEANLLKLIPQPPHLPPLSDYHPSKHNEGLGGRTFPNYKNNDNSNILCPTQGYVLKADGSTTSRFYVWKGRYSI